MKSNTINFDEKYTVDSSYDLSLDDTLIEFTNTDYARSDVFKKLMKTSIQSQFIKDDIKNYLKSQDLDKIVKETDIMYVLHDVKEFSHCNDKNQFIEKTHGKSILGSHINQFDTIIRMYHLAIASDQKEIATDIQNKITAEIKKILPQQKHSFYFHQYLKGAARLAKSCDVFDGLKDFFVDACINKLNTNSEYLNTKENHCLRLLLQSLHEYTLLNKDIATTVQQLMKKPNFISGDTLPIITDYVNKVLLSDNKLQADSKDNDYSNKVKVYIPLFVPKYGNPTEADLNKKSFEDIASIINKDIADAHYQVGKTPEETVGVVGQHSWYKRNKGYVLVEAMIDQKMVKTMAESDLSDALNAGEKAYPTILPSSVIKTNDIISIRNGDGIKNFQKRDNLDFQNYGSSEYITLFEVMQTGLTVQQIMNPTEKNLETLIERRRHVVGKTLEEVQNKITSWANGGGDNKTAIVEFRAKKSYLEKCSTYHGGEGYIYKGVILPHDIQRIYPRSTDFIMYAHRNRDLYKDIYEKFYETCESTGYENPLLKMQPSTHMTTLFNGKTQKDLEDKVLNTSTPNATSST